MLHASYTRICDACGAEITVENFSLDNNSVLPIPLPSRHGMRHGGWFYDMCDGCFGPLYESWREVRATEQATKDASRAGED